MVAQEPESFHIIRMDQMKAANRSNNSNINNNNIKAVMAKCDQRN